MSNEPALSVVVAIVSDTTSGRSDPSYVARCLEALGRQYEAPPVEIIVPYHPRIIDARALHERFPQVEFIPITDLKTYSGAGGSREHHDELRAHGIKRARGRVIALLEDHGVPDKSWCHRIVEAHASSHAGVGGAIENGVDRLINWAVYYCDFGKYQNPLREGETTYASDANISYKRSALERIAPEWQDSFHETVVNGKLLASGEALLLRPDIVVYQHRLGLDLHNAIEERFVWGRSYAGTRSRLLSVPKRFVYALLSPLLPALLLLRMTVTALRKGRYVQTFMKALPLIGLLTVAWSVGELVGYVTARPSSAR